jgi:6,7-dimethyl-8-ribityllumazine synthase
MPTELQGTDGELPEGVLALVVSRYNASITEKLLEGALAALRAGGVAEDDVIVARVPGAWELPLAVSELVAWEEVAGVLALGAVIRGETTHDQHINQNVSRQLMDLSLEYGKPVAMGLLTCNTVEQAIHRSGGNVGNKGTEAAEAVLEMLRLRRKIDRL